MSLATQATTYYRRNAALAALAGREVVKRQRRPREAAQEWGRYQAASATLAISTGVAVLEEQNINADGPTVTPLGFVAGMDVLTGFVERADELSLTLLVQTLVADSGRSAGGVVTATRRVETGYVRYTVGQTCDRCTILAGRWYRYSTGFQRHPFCDCVMLPASREASPELVRDPTEAFDNGLVTGLSQAQADAIREGADMARVVNAKRGMRMTNFGGRRIQTTTEGARRGVARLTPESIYRLSSTRDERLRLLATHGYIT